MAANPQESTRGVGLREDIVNSRISNYLIIGIGRDVDDGRNEVYVSGELDIYAAWLIVSHLLNRDYRQLDTDQISFETQDNPHQPNLRQTKISYPQKWATVQQGR